jgi:Ni/Co efflux regulator RcnB
MNKTLIALLTAASLLTIGAAQANDKPMMDKPAAEAAAPAKHHAKKHVKHHAKKHAKHHVKKHADKMEGAAK